MNSVNEQDLLRLAYLKENFKYRDFYKGYFKDFCDKYSLFIGQQEDTWQYYNRFMAAVSSLDVPHFGGIGEPHGLIDFILTTQRGGAGILTGNIDFAPVSPGLVMEVLNPLKTTEGPLPNELGQYLHVLFRRQRVKAVYPWNNSDIAFNQTGVTGHKLYLQPYEIALVVDTRGKTKNIIDSIKIYLKFPKKFNDVLKRASTLAGVPEDDIKRELDIVIWEPDNARHRKEAWQHLEVWKARRKRKGFAEIAQELGYKTEDAAKKSFYKAYELSQGRDYDPEKLKPRIWRFEKEEVARSCATCPDRATCTELCPDVLLYVDHDTKSSTTEKLL